MEKKGERDYISDDGFSLLCYLGLIKSLSEQERCFFATEWEDHYNSGDSITKITSKLYAGVIPALLDISDHDKRKLSQTRKIDFFDRLKRTDLEKKLTKGKSFGEITSEEGDHKWIIEVSDGEKPVYASDTGFSIGYISHLKPNSSLD